MIMQKFNDIAERKSRNIGIGLGDSENHNQRILMVILDFLKNFQSNIYIFGREDSFKNLLEKITPNNIHLQINYIKCGNPEKSIFEYLEKNKIHAIIRGSMSSSKFLKNLKIHLKVKEINRLAILETINGHQFFYGPVGIDECNNLENKTIFLELAIKEFEKHEIIPKISILSGGRINDKGRDTVVDQSMQDANRIVELVNDKYPHLKISHDEILIEKAIENKSNLIIAPDGISGNLIYRTLVHLGGGKAYGAIYLGIQKTIIDTSRVGEPSEIYGALILALALSN